MLFPGDSADLSEHVAQAMSDSGLLASLSTLSQCSASSTDDGQPGKRFLGRSQSQQTAELLRRAKQGQRKQVILDAYMDKKILAHETPEANAARLRQKLNKLSVHSDLDPEDSDQVLQRGQLYLQNMRPLCHQKLKRSSSSAARVAFEAERQYNSHDGLCIVMDYMRGALHEHQGPQARRGAMQRACVDVIAALAFPQPADWQAELNAFIVRGVKVAKCHPPGFCCKKTACKLNLSEPPSASHIADKYFYDKIVTHWNVGANQGHIQDKLQALLPLLSNSDILSQVHAAAKACQRDMDDLCCKKKASEAQRRQMRRKLSDST